MQIKIYRNMHEVVDYSLDPVRIQIDFAQKLSVFTFFNYLCVFASVLQIHLSQDTWHICHVL